MALINFQFPYIPDPQKGNPLEFCQLFVGEPDLDPEIPVNQKQLNVVQEDDNTIPVAQPLIFSAGGTPVYDGSTVRLDVDGDYSFKILDKNGQQIYYVHSVAENDPLTEQELFPLLKSSGYYTIRTESEAKSDTEAEAGQYVRISDRGYGLFQYQAGLTPNTYNIIAADAAGLDLILIPIGYLSTYMFGYEDGFVGDLLPLLQAFDDYISVNYIDGEILFRGVGSIGSQLVLGKDIVPPISLNKSGLRYELELTTTYTDINGYAIEMAESTLTAATGYIDIFCGSHRPANKAATWGCLLL